MSCPVNGQTNFYPRPPRGGRPEALRPATPERWISIHALREEGDSLPCWIRFTTLYFYPRPPRGGRLHSKIHHKKGIRFLSTPSARRATSGKKSKERLNKDFYPRPPRGGRLVLTMKKMNIKIFLSTPSARRATLRPWVSWPKPVISIHALREEGDNGAVYYNVDWFTFLSTPSARRATWWSTKRWPTGRYFYPRPPRGGRRLWSTNAIGRIRFLSTPSARRATKG